MIAAQNLVKTFGTVTAVNGVSFDVPAGEIFAFLGCSRLEEPLNRYAVSAVVHGHAHAGAAEGKTAANIPVYNVAVPVLRRAAPNRPAYRLIELPVDGETAEPAAEPEAAPRRRAGIEVVR